MPLPIVAIVGRPNVGKSSLLNMLARRRISIVDPTAGVTRDRVQATCDHEGVHFDVVDTGGYGIVDRDDLSEKVEQQICYAVAEAAVILFVVDAREGLLPLDFAAAEWLRGHNKPVILLANKVDSPDMPAELGELHRLGFGEPLPVSALHRRGDSAIRERIVEHVRGLAEGGVRDEAVMKIAMVGRRNVGKSTFINALAGQERMIVSEIAGTTRDAVDVRFECGGQSYIAIDTAGVRKRGKISDDIEYYSYQRAQASVRRADVVLLLIDATVEVGVIEKKLGVFISQQHKPCVIVVNKWDLAKGRASTEAYSEYLLETLPHLDYAPAAFTTATRGKNAQATIDLAMSLFKQARTRVSTGQLNAILKEALAENSPRPKRGDKAVKILYATQVAICPPTIVLFVNAPSRINAAYERFLANRFREALPFPEVPIRLVFRPRRAMLEAEASGH